MTVGEESSEAPSPLAVQARVLSFWETTGVPQSVLAGRPEGPTFRFTEGPPTANGAPHLGHLVARVLKDAELRYRRMRGMRIVSPMAGWDCHGLPVELEIEKRHGLKSKKEIEAYGVERFCEECRTGTLEVASVWQEMSRRLGYWLDYEHAYRTMDPPYVESVWWSLKTLFETGLLEKGHYVLPVLPSVRNAALLSRGRPGVPRERRTPRSRFASPSRVLPESRGSSWCGRPLRGPCRRICSWPPEPTSSTRW